MTDNHIEPVPDLQRALENILQVLQTTPKQYRNFGPYWWAVKAMLKRHGYTKEHFYGLGDSVDREALSRIEAGPDAFVLANALDFYQYHASYNLGSPDTYFPDDGEPYHVADEDIGF